MRTRRIFLSGSLLLLCFASCAPSVGTSPTLVVASAPTNSRICDASDPTTFVNAVRLLPTTFDPNGPPGHYAPPVGSPQVWPQQVQTDLANAFTAAPMFFRQHICGLDGIFISCPGGTCDFSGGSSDIFGGAWGFRSRNHADKGKKYIAISPGLWWQGQAVRLHAYEGQLLWDVLRNANVTQVTTATPDTGALTVLAALAHELGHVLWTETVRDPNKPYGNGSDFDFSALTGCAAGDFFTGWAYDHTDSQHHKLRPPLGWRDFGGQDNDAHSPIDHSAAPFLKVVNGVPGLDSSSPASVASAYQPGQPWPSLFGAWSPDEDFVETYVLAVLTGFDIGTGTFQGQLRSLPVSVAGGPPLDIPRDLRAGNKQKLFNKLHCLKYS
jgi:hypothetical protein